MFSIVRVDSSDPVQDQLNLVAGNVSSPFPDWAAWLVWLGDWMRVQAMGDGRRIAVVRLPTRKVAAAFTVFGALLASARLHDDSLDWEALKELPAGTPVFWREKSLSASGKSRTKSGRILELRTIDNNEFVVVSVDTRSGSGQTTHLFSRSSALGYGITLGSITAKADAQLSGLGRIVRPLTKGFKDSWLRTPHPECLLLSEREHFINDLEGLSINVCGGTAEIFSTVLAPTDTTGHRYGKTRLISPRASVVLDGGFDVIVLDGAKALQRLSETTAKSVIAIVDRAEYDAECEQVVALLMGYRADEFVQVPLDGVRRPPAPIEVVVFGLPNVQNNLYKLHASTGGVDRG
jgi:hypothetical protein